MSFVALPFYGWLAAALAVFYLTPGRWRPACLLAISCAFYLAASPGYFVLLVAQTDFRTASRVAQTSSESARRSVTFFTTSAARPRDSATATTASGRFAMYS